MADSGPQPDSEAETGARSTFAGYASEHRYAIFLVVIFVIGGAIGAPYMFPELPTTRAVLGGVFFGGFCCLCAALPKFL